jgi:hypothetical protein
MSKKAGMWIGIALWLLGLTVFVYAKESTEVFVIYLAIMALWGGLTGYTLWRDRRAKK